MTRPRPAFFMRPSSHLAFSHRGHPGYDAAASDAAGAGRANSNSAAGPLFSFIVDRYAVEGRASSRHPHTAIRLSSHTCQRVTAPPDPGPASYSTSASKTDRKAGKSAAYPSRAGPPLAVGCHPDQAAPGGQAGQIAGEGRVPGNAERHVGAS
jgi:hypothetical protein